MVKAKKNFIRALTAVAVTVSLFSSNLVGYKINAAAAESNVSIAQFEKSGSNDYGLTQNTKDGTILHAFCWSFNTIKNNMNDIAEAGFSSIQTSPANACLVGDNGGMCLKSNGNGAWFYHYQPTDWKLGNYQLGTREEFKEMCDEAHKYGIKIIVDVVPNHTTPTLDAVSSDLINAVGGRDNLYHANGFNEIGDYNDRRECTTGQMGGLPDVNTENPRFEKYFLNYLNDCIDCGADGFRYDTAKHIGLPSDPKDAKSSNNNFWPIMTGEQSIDGVSLKNPGKLFIYGEVLQDRNVKETEYANYISQTASAYGKNLRDAIRSKNFSTNNLLSWSHPVSPSKLVTWAESHDTYCNDQYDHSYDLNDWQIKMEYAVIAARKEGTPLFFSRPDGSSDGNRWGYNKIGAKGNDTFKDPEVAAVNKFRNAMVGQSEYIENLNGSNQILSIERGNKGQVIVNLGGGTNINCSTKLADGKYTDEVSGGEFVVSNGRISGYLQGGKVTVLYFHDPVVKSSVSADPKGCEYTSDKLEITLSASNASDTKYSIDGSEKVAYNNGTKITIGENKDFGKTTTVELSGTGNDGKALYEKFTYTKVDNRVDKAGIYFKKPSGWGNNINAYLYDEKSESSVKVLSSWPGSSMKSLGNDEYFFEIPSNWNYKNTQVIFNDGNNQAPSSIGLDYTLGTAMKYVDGKWNELEIKNQVKESEISASPEDKEYDSDTLDVVLNCSNVTDAKYSIDDAKAVKFTDGTKITIGADKKAGESTVVKLTATDSQGKTISKEYSYKKAEVNESVIYFKKPSGWGNNINIYVYDEKSGSSVEKIAAWPGVSMKSLGNDEYMYKLPSSWKYKNTQVIFNDGSNQLPKSLGFEYTLGTSMKYADNEWTELEK